MIRPALAETIAATTRALRSAHLQPAQLRSILLVGGSSRIPLVSEMLHREFSVPTALDIHPKHDIALGSLRTNHNETDITTAPPPAPVTAGSARRVRPGDVRAGPSGRNGGTRGRPTPPRRAPDCRRAGRGGPRDGRRRPGATGSRARGRGGRPRGRRGI